MISSDKIRLKRLLTRKSVPPGMECDGHCFGPVVAGIVGVNKSQYDIWGDTVSTASLMETSGGASKVNISAVTYALIEDDPGFVFESRDVVAPKGKLQI